FLVETGVDAPDANGNFIGGTTEQSAIDPLLGPLANNGGPTLTHALLPGSLAIDSGENALAVNPADGDSPLTSDQRGGPFLRQVNGIVDMGALEVQTLSGVTLVVDSAPDVVDGDYSAGNLSL